MTTTTGKSGDDTLIGTTGDDKLIGGAGDDTLISGEGDDKLVGGSGDDILDAGTGENDTALGGSGNDTFIYNLTNHLGGANNTYYNGGSGTDTIKFVMTQAEADLYRNDIEVAFNNCLNTDPSGVLTLTFADSTLYLHNFENIEFLITSPVASEDTATTTENAGLNIQVLANDTSPIGSPLIVSNVDTAAHNTKGTVTINPDYTINYDPGTAFDYLAQGETVQDTFSYTVSDALTGDYDTAIVSITVQGTNDAPKAWPDYGFETNEDTTLSIGANQLLANDQDPDASDVLNIASVESVSTKGASVTFDGANVVYNPGNIFQDLKAGESTTDTFGYTISDPHGEISSTTVTVTINGVNDAPVAQNIAVSVAEDSSITGTLVATDVDLGDTLTYSKATNPANGSVTITGNTFEYTPNADYYGTDSFTYEVADSEGATDTATVTITVTSVNDVPVANNVFAIGAEDTVISGQLLASDVEDSTLTYSEIEGPANGSVTITGNTFEYTPNANFYGTDSFTYEVVDSEGATATATATITVNSVNDVPVASDVSVDVAEDGSVTELFDATDVEDASLSYDIVTNPANGVVAVNSDGTFTYTPNANYYGSDSFTYRAADSEGAADIATVSVNVTSVNDAPAITSANTVSVLENTSGSFLQVTANDIEGDTITYSIAGGADSAHFAIDPNTGALSFANSPNYENPLDSDANNMYEVTVSASDGTASAEQTITVTVQDEVETTPLFTEGADTVNFNDVAAGTYTDSPYNALAGDDAVILPSTTVEADEAGYGHTDGVLNPFSGGLGNDVISVGDGTDDGTDDGTGDGTGDGTLDPSDGTNDTTNDTSDPGEGDGTDPGDGGGTDPGGGGIIPPVTEEFNPNVTIYGDKEVLMDDELAGHDTIHGGTGDDTIYGDAVTIQPSTTSSDGSGTDDGTNGGSGSTDPGEIDPGTDDSTDTETGGTGDLPGDGTVDPGDIIDPSDIETSTVAGQDTIYGGAGNDTIYGDVANNMLSEANAAEATDTIYGGPGSDTMYGGTGGNRTDVFVFQNEDINPTAPETDVIKDFMIGPISGGVILGMATGGDVLRLDQVLNNPSDTSSSTLTNYLQLSDATGSLKIDIDVDGIGDFSAPDHTILLENALSSATLSLTDQAAAIQTLIDNGNLEVIP